MATNYDINYEDERFTQVEDAKQEALTEVENTYGDMINQSDSYYQAQIDASKEWVNQQQQLQQENTDFTIEQINQQKEQANKDYLKEQSGAYTDWQKQNNAYGVNAEQMASNGLSNTGFSESSQVSMYNTYQNRVATARESYSKAVLNYDNAIKDAQLQNNSKLAEIAYTALQQQLELSLQGFQYKNSLVEAQLTQKQAVDDRYYNRYQDVLAQMNQENAMAEQIRQYNESLQLQKQQLTEQIRQYEQNYALQVKEYNEKIRQFDEEMARLKKKDAEEYALQIKQLEMQKKQAEVEQAQWEKEYQLKQSQLKAEQAQWEKEYELKKKELQEQQKQFNASLRASQSSSRNASIEKDNKSSYELETEYYQGDLNSDVEKYGAFSNGYQPKGIKGYGTVKKSGETIKITTTTLSGKKQTLVQNVWVTSDGTEWYWDGKYNKYIMV